MTVKPLNLTLYLVLDPDLCSQSVGIVETALAAVQAGAGIVQLRAPTWKKRRMTEWRLAHSNLRLHLSMCRSSLMTTPM